MVDRMVFLATVMTVVTVAIATFAYQAGRTDQATVDYIQSCPIAAPIRYY